MEIREPRTTLLTQDRFKGNNLAQTSTGERVWAFFWQQIVRGSKFQTEALPQISIL